jgi:Rad3-related DNA helicase
MSDGIKLRPHQKEVLEKIRNMLASTSLSDTKIVGIYLSPGLGKTLIAILAAKLYGAKALIAAVRTRDQMKSYARDIDRFWQENAEGVKVDFRPIPFFAKFDMCPNVQEALSKLRRGRPRSGEPRSREKDSDDDEDGEEEELREFLASMYECRTCLQNIEKIPNPAIAVKVLDELRPITKTADVEKYRSNASRIFFSNAAQAGVASTCPYAWHKALAKTALSRDRQFKVDVPILISGTYPYLFGRPLTLLRNIIEDADHNGIRIAVVVDEAHNLLGIGKLLERSVSTQGLRKLERRLSSLYERISDEQEKACKKDCGGKEECKRNCEEESRRAKERYFERVGRIHEEIGRVEEALYGLVKERLCAGLANDEACRSNAVDIPVRIPRDSKTTRAITAGLRTLAALFRETAIELAGLPVGSPQEAIKQWFDAATRQISTTDEKVGMAVRLLAKAARLDEALRMIEVRETDTGVYAILRKRSMAIITRPVHLAKIMQGSIDIIENAANKGSPSWIGSLWIFMSGTPIPDEIMEKLFGIRFTIPPIGPRIGQGKLHVVFNDELILDFDHRSEEMYRRYAEEIKRILDSAPPGYRLIVYPSYAVMKNVLRHYKELQSGEALKYDVVEGENAKRIDDIERHYEQHGIANVHAVARGKFMEGVEYIREGKSMLKAVIMAGVPFPNPRDEYLQDVISASGVKRDEMMRWMALATTIQTLGRAIRTPDDEAVAYLLDKRFRMFRGSICSDKRGEDGGQTVICSN